MSRAASDIGDGDFLTTVANGDAVITSADDAVSNGDQFWGAKVHSIGVGAISWCYNVHVCSSEIIGIKYRRVKAFAINWREPINDRVVQSREFNWLKKKRKINQ